MAMKRSGVRLPVSLFDRIEAYCEERGKSREEPLSRNKALVELLEAMLCPDEAGLNPDIVRQAAKASQEAYQAGVEAEAEQDPEKFEVRSDF